MYCGKTNNATSCCGIARLEVERAIPDVLANKRVMSMKENLQHGNTSTYEHCLFVAAVSVRIAKALHMRTDLRELATGAMLHDFFLYDWHDGRKRKPGFFGFHCFYHPKKALDNAMEDFSLTWREQNIIRSHMFPTTMLHPPMCAEAWVVCMADKWCAVCEVAASWRLRHCESSPRLSRWWARNKLGA